MNTRVLVPGGERITQTLRCTDRDLAIKTTTDGFVGEIGPDTLEHVEDRYLMLVSIEAQKIRRLRRGGWAWKITYLFQPLWLVEIDIDALDWRRNLFG